MGAGHRNSKAADQMPGHRSLALLKTASSRRFGMSSRYVLTLLTMD